MSEVMIPGDEHFDLESQINQVSAEVGSTASSMHRWRSIAMPFYVRKAFMSSTAAEKKELLADAFDDNGQSPSKTSISLINTSGTGDGDRNVELMSTSLQVSLELSDGADESNKHSTDQQNAEMAKIVKAKDLNSLHEFGGVRGFAVALDIDLENGLSSDEADLCCRCATCPQSETAQAPQEGFFQILLNAGNKYVNLLLLLFALLSIVFGILEKGLETGWYEGFLVIVAIIALIAVHVLCKYWYLWNLSGRMKLLKNSGRSVVVFRGGRRHEISTSNVLLGEIICLNEGDQIPADGLFISGESLKLDDESQATIDDQNPFMFCGAMVINGNGRMLAISIGNDTVWGEMMSNVTNVPYEKTPFQVQLDWLNTCIQITGLLVTIIVLIVLFLQFKFENGSDGPGSYPDPKGKPSSIKEFMDALQKIVTKPRGKTILASLAIFLVSVSEGLPLVAALAINHWNRKALSGKGTAQDFLACITTGSVTAICTDITCALTQNQMEVEMIYVGEELINKESDIAPYIREALCIGIGTPSLRLQGPCSLVQDALLSWASLKLDLKIENLKQDCVIHSTELNCDEETWGVLMSKNKDNGEHTNSHWRGPARSILAMCSLYYNCNGTKNAINEQKRMAFKRVIEEMQDKQLKTVAFGYEPTDVPTLEKTDLILLGLLGLKHPLGRTIEACKDAGVNIKLVSGRNMSELKSFVLESGWNLHNSDSVVSGETFRNSSHENMMEMVDRICVMGNALPSDKLLIVKCLKEKGHVVAMAGGRTDETPAIKEADVGITMGASSTEMARECPNINISDGDINFLFTIMKCGRCAYENIQKFIQLELTMTIAWLLITISMTACFGDSPITAIQYLWICLIVTVLGGMALLTEPPNEKLMKKPPVGRTNSLVTRAMWRNILPQALYQAAILVTFQFKARAILDISQKVSKTMIFNSFVLCQVFNLFSAREMQKKNVFKGIHRNCWFWVALVDTIVLQEVFIEIADILASTGNLNIEEWAICFLIGVILWVIDWTGKCMSDFMAYGFSRQQFSSTGSTGMTAASSSESLGNLELPLIDESSL